MAIVAALAEVDVASGKLERRVGTHALHLLDRRAEQEQRHDLDQAADGDNDEDADQQHHRVLLEDVVFHLSRSLFGRRGEGADAQLGGRGDARLQAMSTGLSPRTVRQTFKAMSSDPMRNSEPPVARMT